MAYQLVWTAEAEDDFNKIILYLKKVWSVQSAEKFITQTYKRLERIVVMPSIGRATSLQSEAEQLLFSPEKYINSPQFNLVIQVDAKKIKALVE